MSIPVFPVVELYHLFEKFFLKTDIPLSVYGWVDFNYPFALLRLSNLRNDRVSTWKILFTFSNHLLLQAASLQ